MPKVLFVSDLHLGVPDAASSRARERDALALFEALNPATDALVLLGDIFDFWFEWRHVVPKGYTRLLGALARLTDAGLPLHVFGGNHDGWMFSYLQDEIGAKVYLHPQQMALLGRQFYLAHGDGLGPGDHRYKAMKRVFRNGLAQRLFASLHPGHATALATWSSHTSRKAQQEGMNGTGAPSHSSHSTDAALWPNPPTHLPLGQAWGEPFLGTGEWLIQHARAEMAAGNPADVYMMGHRHHALVYGLGGGNGEHGAAKPWPLYVNTGDYLSLRTYVTWDGTQLALRRQGQHESLTVVGI